MRVKFLFWNIRKSRGTRFTDCLARIADSGIDVFLFAEAPSDSAIVLSALNRPIPGVFAGIPSLSSRIKFFSRVDGPLAGALWTDRFFDELYDRVTAIELQPQGTMSILIVGAHLDSPATGISVEGRAEWARDVASDVRTIERDMGHARTLLVGDMNMNPYDGGLVQTTALHAVVLVQREMEFWLRRIS